MQYHNFFPLNDTMQDPNARGTSPFGFTLHESITVGAMTAGAKTITLTGIPFGKNLGTVLGAELLNTDGGDAVTAATPDLNPILSISAAAGSNAGEVDVTIKTSDATVTTNTYVVTFKLWGRILPVAVS
jgi:hypothetical protein